MSINHSDNYIYMHMILRVLMIFSESVITHNFFNKKKVKIKKKEIIIAI